MDPRLLEYYNSELRFLREAGAEPVGRPRLQADRRGREGREASALGETLRRIVLNDVAPGPRRWITHAPAGWLPVM